MMEMEKVKRIERRMGYCSMCGGTIFDAFYGQYTEKRVADDFLGTAIETRYEYFGRRCRKCSYNMVEEDGDKSVEIFITPYGMENNWSDIVFDDWSSDHTYP